MLKKTIFLAFIFLVCIFQSFATNIELKTNIGENVSYFEYVFIFQEEVPSSFSIEKPKNSIIEYVSFEKNSNLSIKYSQAGDFFIFRPSGDVDNDSIRVRFSSDIISKNIFETESFSTYLNFNFPVDSLKYQIYLDYNFGEISNIAPRNYELIENNYYEWIIENPKEDLFFLLSFNLNLNNNDEDDFFNNYLIFILISPMILFIILLFIIKKYFLKSSNEKKNMQKKSSSNFDSSSDTLADDSKEKKDIDKQNNNLNQDVDHNYSINVKSFPDTIISNSKNNLELNQNKIDEIKEKYLTENEKQVVDIVRKTDGISQNDILNSISTISKSNLSKIISKLHSKRILNRIKVGKINKIHLGEKLKLD